MHRRETATAPASLQQQIVKQCKLANNLVLSNSRPRINARLGPDTSALREQAQALLKQQVQQRACKRSHFQKVLSSEAEQHQMTRPACPATKNFARCTLVAFTASAACAPVRSYVHEATLHLM